MRIAYWGDAGWALGRIGRQFQKYLGVQVDLYDWSDCESNTDLFLRNWRSYDTIITTTMFNQVENSDFDPEVYKRLFIISHFPVFGHAYFCEEVCVRPGARYAGVSPETCREMERNGMTPVHLMPFGVDTDEFPRIYSVTGPIRRIGIIGNPDGPDDYVENKGLRAFSVMCVRLGLEPVYIHHREGTVDLYEGIDLLVSFSRLEAGPLGIFEAAACGLPVLTRPVGNAQRIKGVALFDTVDEAVVQVRKWNNHLGSLKDYVDRVTEEVRTNWSMEKLIRLHGQVIFQQTHL